MARKLEPGITASVIAVTIATAGIAAVASFTFASQANAAANGISALIQVTQLKAQFANEEALEGADKQRDLVKNQKRYRGMRKHKRQ